MASRDSDTKYPLACQWVGSLRLPVLHREYNVYSLADYKLYGKLQTVMRTLKFLELPQTLAVSLKRFDMSRRGKVKDDRRTPCAASLR